MARILQVVAPLLLLLLPTGLRELLSPTTTIDHQPSEGAANGGGTTTGGGEVLLHPLVLVPGLTCSELEARLTDAYRPSVPRCGAMKGKGWFGLWANCSDLPAHHYVQCFIEQMTLVYDPAANDYRNLPGVETRVRGFGSSRGFQRNPEHTTWCFEVLRHELEKAGYRDGDTLFAAQYDLRYAPPVPGQSSEVFSRYFRRLTRLIEDASEKNENKKVILFGHSFGGMVALEFVRSTPMSWRDRYIKHLILVAPVPAEGLVQTLHYFVSGSDLMYIPTVAQLSLTLRPMWRSFESSIVNIPSPAVFGDRPLVVTARRNYSAYDVEDLLADIGFGAGVEPFTRRAVPKMTSFQAPMVPTTCINGVGNNGTPEQLVYWDGDFDAEPEIVYGDGDNTINLISMLAFDEKMRRQPEQNKLYKSIKLHGAEHGTIVREDWALKRVMQEILEANRDDFLVASTDGPGTKLKLAFEIGIYDIVGIDLTAEMSGFYTEGEYDLSGFAVGNIDDAAMRRTFMGIRMVLVVSRESADRIIEDTHGAKPTYGIGDVIHGEGNARELFDKMMAKNLMAWTAMINGNAQTGRPKAALA
ncbi:unnamed protein product [Miscanthus lutarioriparius]|uniref:Lecithin-cholesterol acyltransferase-like 1 n=1 Tax=Miscanthus lutarioriparius TaxID=422564 RepID=A0A811P8V7_9POAL|nr:unnamed protein product [Miscanthus lutarioriparius]